MSIFAGKTLMITGGTGSFGNAVLKRFLRTDIAEIRIFSRDEKKQDDMRHEYQAKFPDVAHKIKFDIGDLTFEIAGRNKGKRQIEDLPDSYVVKDDIEFAHGNTLPLWSFGLNY